MNDEDIEKLVRALKSDSTKIKPVKELAVPAPPQPVKIRFHHDQKVKIISGYYKTYKGFVKSFKVENNKVFYHVLVNQKNNEDLFVWCMDEQLKVSLF